MGSKPLRVTIIDNSRGFHCGDCYTPGPSAEDVGFVMERLEAQFGDAVAVDYIDLALIEDNEPRVGLLAWVEANGMPLPVVAINDVPKLSGAMAYRPIAEAIDTLREVSLG